jgi:hypothetical protein
MIDILTPAGDEVVESFLMQHLVELFHFQSI